MSSVLKFVMLNLFQHPWPEVASGAALMESVIPGESRDPF